MRGEKLAFNVFVWHYSCQSQLTCVLNNIPATALAGVPTLANALCSNTTRLSNVSVCVQTSCDWSDQVNTSKVEDMLCAGYPMESRSNNLRILAAVLSGVVFPIVGLKLYTRWITSHQLWADDYTALAAAVSSFQYSYH